MIMVVLLSPTLYTLNALAAASILATLETALPQNQSYESKGFYQTTSITSKPNTTFVIPTTIVEHIVPNTAKSRLLVGDVRGDKMIYKRNVSTSPNERISSSLNAIDDNHTQQQQQMQQQQMQQQQQQQQQQQHVVYNTKYNNYNNYNQNNDSISSDLVLNMSSSTLSPKLTRATFLTKDGGGGDDGSGGGTVGRLSDGGGNVGSTVASIPNETIKSIRSNVTRILDMYFKNVTDEYGYGAATTTKTYTTTAATRTTSSSSTSPLIVNTTTSSSLTAIPQTALATNVNEDVNSLATESIPFKQIATDFLTNATKTISEALTTSLSEATSMAPSTSSSSLATIDEVRLPFTSTLSATSSSMASSAVAEAGAGAVASTAFNSTKNLLKTAPSITYPTYSIPIQSQKECFDLYSDYVQPQEGLFCNWTWDTFLCWPPTPAGVLARMHCPAGWHGIDVKKFANRKCELDGRWGAKPNESYNPLGWTDYRSCYKPEVNKMMSNFENLELTIEIAHRTRSLEMVGLVLSLFALIVSLIIFCNFRSLRNNRTKIHKNLFYAMVLQVLIRLTLYVDQAKRRSEQENIANRNIPGIESTPYLCEASYVLLEYARTTMFMWMFIEGLYLHNMVTVAVFQGRFPHTIFSIVGWGLPAIMTTIWAVCTAYFTDTDDCWINYNLTPYYWILEGPRSVVILLNFVFLINIISVLVVKLRQSQASDIEQTRKATRAAIVLLPLLGITNLLHLVPPMKTTWKFALWSYVTYFLTSFQGFFIALIYCFLNGEVRAALLKSIAVYMSVRGHPEWVPKRASMYSAAYNTAHDTEAQAQNEGRRNESPPNKRNGRKPSTTTVLMQSNLNTKSCKSKRLLLSSSPNGDRKRQQTNHQIVSQQNSHQLEQTHRTNNSSSNWAVSLCFRGQKVLRVPTASSVPPESVIFELSEQ